MLYFDFLLVVLVSLSLSLCFSSPWYLILSLPEASLPTSQIMLSFSYLFPPKKQLVSEGYVRSRPAPNSKIFRVLGMNTSGDPHATGLNILTFSNRFLKSNKINVSISFAGSYLKFSGTALVVQW